MIFQYAQLLKGSLRLVRFHPNSTPASIHLTLEHQERYFDKNVHYTALAYETQASGDEMKDITLQGRTKMIPRILWQALSALVEHHDTSGRFWIDYVCVNQRDDAEKSAHASQLPSIYASADEVLFWVGSDDTFAGADRKEETYRIDIPLSDLATSLRSPKDTVAFQSALERLQLQRANKILLLSHKSLTEVRQSDAHSAL